MKKTIVFIIPGLTGPLPSAWEEKMQGFKSESTFEYVFKRARHEQIKGATFSDTLVHYFKLPKEVPWSFFGLRGEQICVDTPDWLKVDILTNNGYPVRNERDIERIAEDFARDFSFGEDAIVTANSHWYISPRGKNNFCSRPVWFADLDDQTHGLSGGDASIWQLRMRTANEWLKKHPINDARIRRQRAPLMKFWVWGNNGKADFKSSLNFSAVFSDNPMYLGLAAQLGLSFFPLRLSTGDLSQMVHNHPRICVIDDSLNNTISEGNIVAWCRERERICTQLLEPALLAIERGIIEEFIIDNGQGDRYFYNKRIKFVITKPKFTYTFNHFANENC